MEWWESRLAYYYEHQAEFEAEILRQAERAKAWAEAAKDSPMQQRLKRSTHSTWTPSFRLH